MSADVGSGGSVGLWRCCVVAFGCYGLSAAIKTHAVTIQKGGRRGWVDVPLVDDSTDEPAGQITAAVKSGVGYNVPPQEHQATVTVHDDDCPSGYQKKPLPVNYFHVLTGEMTTDRDVALNWSPQPPGGEWAAKGEWVMSTDPGDPGCFTLTRPPTFIKTVVDGLIADWNKAYNSEAGQIIVKSAKLVENAVSLVVCFSPTPSITTYGAEELAKRAAQNAKRARRIAQGVIAVTSGGTGIALALATEGYCRAT